MNYNYDTFSIKNFLSSLLVILFLASCNSNNEIIVNYNNPKIKYQGRIDTTQIKGAELYWSGTSIKMNFKGDSISALMDDNKGDNYYNVIIDNDSIRIIRPDTIKKQYLLASGLPKGEHSIEIFKRTEWNRGKSTFYGFKINGSAKILNPTPAKRKIEFYGNSISAGYGVEDYSGKDSPDSTYTNNYLSYAALTARHFNADYRCICRSGIGITISWDPLIMPEMYDRLIPEDATSKWNFSAYAPDIVVVNLLQNDSWLVEMPDYPEFKKRFGNKKPDEKFIKNAYQKFILSLRNKYPKATIICALGNMDITSEKSKWPKLVEKAVKELDYANIFTHIMPYKKTDGHPKIEEQQIMANSLISFINKKVKW